MKTWKFWFIGNDGQHQVRSVYARTEKQARKMIANLFYLKSTKVMVLV